MYLGVRSFVVVSELKLDSRTRKRVQQVQTTKLSNLGTFLIIKDSVKNYVLMATRSYHNASIISTRKFIFESKSVSRSRLFKRVGRDGIVLKP